MLTDAYKLPQLLPLPPVIAPFTCKQKYIYAIITPSPPPTITL